MLRTAEQVGKLAQNLAQNGAQAMSQGVTVSVTYGEQKSVETQHSEGNKVEKSQVNAGGKVNLQMSGGGNVARGNGESKAYVESQVGSLGSRTEIESGETLTVQGSQVLGKGVKVKADNLRIESLQDTMKYEGKQESASGQVTVGYGVSGSASYSKTKMKADSASVNKQAGIFAGDEGYDVDIAGHTELVGGLVTSTEKAEAEGQNRFATGTIASQDLENHADYKGSAVSASGSVGANFDTPFGEKGIAQSTKTKKDKEGNEVLTHGAESLQTGLVVGLGLDKDSQRSQTKSGINTANLVIRDEQAQLAKTGKTAEEAKAGLNTAITTDNAAAHSGKLENRFDKAKLQKELDLSSESNTGV